MKKAIDILSVRDISGRSTYNNRILYCEPYSEIDPEKEESVRQVGWAAYLGLYYNFTCVVYFKDKVRGESLMSGKFSVSEKIMSGGALLAIVAAIIVRCILGVADMGVLVILAFAALLLFVILSVAALFPATWRMTEKQKEKIKDIEKFQNNYRRAFVIINLVCSVAMSALIFVI